MRGRPPPGGPARRGSLELLYQRGCGLAVQQATVVACVWLPGQGRRRTSEVRTCEPTTAARLQRADWLTEQGVTQVVMERTGGYWRPVFNRLEGRVTVLLVHAQPSKTGPGRQTDAQACAWLAELLELGLLRASCLPPPPMREVWELTRDRHPVVQERTREGTRVPQRLASAPLQRGLGATESLGASGRAMLRALVAGARVGGGLAEWATSVLRHKRAPVVEALTGRLTAHHAALLGERLAPLESLEATLARLSERMATALQPYATHVAPWQTRPGVTREAAERVLAEMGVDLSRFPSAAHLASWAGICPGPPERAGKRKPGRTRQGPPWRKPLGGHVAGVRAAPDGQIWGPHRPGWPAAAEKKGGPGRGTQHRGGRVSHAAG